MLLLFAMFVFYLLHIHFLAKHLIWGVSGAYFFNLYAPYRFSHEVAVETLVYCVSCAVAFVAGHVLSKPVLDKRLRRLGENEVSGADLRKAVRLLNIFLVFHIGLGLYALAKAGFNYSAIFNLKMSMSFLFHSRAMLLVLLGFVCLNIPSERWFRQRELRGTARLLIVYFVVSVFMQSRSVVFECGAVVGFSWLMWQGNRIRVRYIVVLLCMMVVPNLIALPRFGRGLDWQETLHGIFSFEYSVAMDNIISATIAADHRPLPMDLFISIPSLLVPSPVRKVLGTEITPGAGGDYYRLILEDAGVLGGGFSLLAQMYMTLGWWGISMFVFLGFLIGKLIKGAANVGKVGLLYAAAPLIYAQFIISLRNDFATFAKYSIQVMLVAMVMKWILRTRWIPRASRSSEGQGSEGIDRAAEGMGSEHWTRVHF
jgi:hypothetical protein